MNVTPGGTSRLGQALGEWVRRLRRPEPDKIGTIVVELPPYVMRVLGDVFLTWGKWWVLVGGLLCLDGEIWGICRRVFYSKLMKEKDRLEEIIKQFDYPGCFQHQLMLLAECKLKLGSGERISVYRHDGCVFELKGRWADNPQYRKMGRPQYPDKEGCIARAWEESYCEISGLPNPVTDFEGYLRAQAEYNVPREVAERLSMPSRSYIGMAIRDPRTKEKIAVVVVESTQPNGLNSKMFKTEMRTKGEADRIADFLIRMAWIEPSLKHAREEGY